MHWKIRQDGLHLRRLDQSGIRSLRLRIPSHFPREVSHGSGYRAFSPAFQGQGPLLDVQVSCRMGSFPDEHVTAKLGSYVWEWVARPRPLHWNLNSKVRSQR